jgi:hypothetical protein
MRIVHRLLVNRISLEALGVLVLLGAACGGVPDLNGEGTVRSDITGGSPLGGSDPAWVGELVRSPTAGPFCTASLIDSRHVLAAGHCIFGHGTTGIIVRAVGAYFRLRDGTVVAGKYAFYDRGWQDQNFPHDAAVIELADPISAPLPDVIDDALPANGASNLIVVGAGRPGYALLKLGQRVVNNSFSLNGGLFIEGQGLGGGVCNGDSGGPLIGGNHLFGIVSDFACSGCECTSGNLTTFTRMHDAAVFIQNVLHGGSLDTRLDMAIDPCANAHCGDNWYCAGNCGATGPAGTRYHCVGQRAIETQQCAGGCSFCTGPDQCGPSCTADPCASAHCGDNWYCAGNCGATGIVGTRYHCVGQRAIETQQCAGGCSFCSGPDQCGPCPPDPCANAHCGDNWYCAGNCGATGPAGTRYHCVGQRAVETQQCAGGCSSCNGSDQCGSCTADLGANARSDGGTAMSSEKRTGGCSFSR